MDQKHSKLEPAAEPMELSGSSSTEIEIIRNQAGTTLTRYGLKYPKAEEFRPIVIESPLYKFIELRFLPKLRDYLVKRLDKNQTGFVPGCGTSVNIQLLIEARSDIGRKEEGWRVLSIHRLLIKNSIFINL